MIHFILTILLASPASAKYHKRERLELRVTNGDVITQFVIADKNGKPQLSFFNSRGMKKQIITSKQNQEFYVEEFIKLKKGRSIASADCVRSHVAFYYWKGPGKAETVAACLATGSHQGDELLRLSQSMTLLVANGK